MSVICADIIKVIEKLAPLYLAESWDNVGLIIGRRDRVITKILVALDATSEVVDEAVKIGAELIITHHPLIFKAISKVSDTTPLGKNILKLIENKICVYSMHTNLDIAYGGTNDEFAERIGLTNIEPMLITDIAVESGIVQAIGRKGILENPISLESYAAFIKEKIGLGCIRFVGEADRTIKTVGLSTGSGSNVKNFTEAIKHGCDVYITGDIRFHEAQEALSLGLALIDATHYASENIIVDKINNYLRLEFNEKNIDISIENSIVDGQVFKSK